MTITESCERTLPSLSPYIKRPIKMCVIVFQIDMFFLIFELFYFFCAGSHHLKGKIRNFIFFWENSDFPSLHKALVKINFGHKIFICQPIFKIFVALFTTFGMQKDNKITLCWRCFRTR